MGSSTDNNDLESSVFREKLEMLNSATPSAIMSNTILIGVIATYFWTSGLQLKSGLWALTFILLLVGRYRLYKTFTNNKDNINLHRWAGWYTVGTSLVGLLWGLSLFIFSASGHYTDSLLITVIIIVTIAGGSIISAVHLPASSGLIICGAGPIGVFMIQGGSVAEKILGVLAFCYSYILIKLTYNFNIWLMASIRHRLSYEQQAIQLEHALAESAKANQAQSDFLANVSHEIRTPMTGLLGMLQFIRESPASKEADNYLQIAQASAKSLLVLINDILDMSKLQSGEFSIDPTPCEIRAMIADPINLLESTAREKGIELKLNFHFTEEICLLMDGSRIRQIILNLAGNAIKFTDKGSVNVDVHCNKLFGTHYEVAIDIRDTGVGISEEAMQTLFDRFIQADNTASRNHAGTGLGLAICKDLIQLMNGTITAKSQPGMGSTFSVKLPATAALKKQDDASNITDTNKINQAIHCLVVDDNQVNLLIIDKLLKNAGWTAVTTNNGLDAIDLFRKNPEAFDLILMDIQMPNMDGIETTQKIRAINHKGKNIPIIAITANCFNETVQHLFDQGFDGYVSKPIVEKLLYAEIISLINTPKNHQKIPKQH